MKQWNSPLGGTFPEFERDHITQLAILKGVEIVGEAASRVSADTKEAHPEIPWPEIIGLRNRLVHAYFEVNLQRVWRPCSGTSLI